MVFAGPANPRDQPDKEYIANLPFGETSDRQITKHNENVGPKTISCVPSLLRRSKVVGHLIPSYLF
jgi:hypothetical protein